MTTMTTMANDIARTIRTDIARHDGALPVDAASVRAVIEHAAPHLYPRIYRVTSGREATRVHFTAATRPAELDEVATILRAQWADGFERVETVAGIVVIARAGAAHVAPMPPQPDGVALTPRAWALLVYTRFNATGLILDVAAWADLTDELHRAGMLRRSGRRTWKVTDQARKITDTLPVTLTRKD